MDNITSQQPAALEVLRIVRRLRVLKDPSTAVDAVAFGAPVSASGGASMQLILLRDSLESQSRAEAAQQVQALLRGRLARANVAAHRCEMEKQARLKQEQENDDEAQREVDEVGAKAAEEAETNGVNTIHQVEPEEVVQVAKNVDTEKTQQHAFDTIDDASDVQAAPTTNDGGSECEIHSDGKGATNANAEMSGPPM